MRLEITFVIVFLAANLAFKLVSLFKGNMNESVLFEVTKSLEFGTTDLTP